MPIYNKLVRDAIPEVIKKTGKDFSTRILEEEEYKAEVKKKLGEELEEYKDAYRREFICAQRFAEFCDNEILIEFCKQNSKKYLNK